MGSMFQIMNDIKNIDKYRLESLERVLDVLECFTPKNQELTLTDLKKLSHQNHTSLKRIVSTLCYRNYLSQIEGTKKYRLGLKLFEIGSVAYSSLSFRKVAIQHLSKLRDDTGLTVLLGTLVDEHLVYVDKWEAASPIKVSPQIGSRRPPNFGILGQVLLAYSPQNITSKLLEKYRLEKYTEHTIVELEVFKARLENIRRDNYVFEREEIHPGIMGWAAPIFKSEGRLVAAAGIVTPVIMVDENKEGPGLIKKLKKAVINISTELGYSE